MTPRLCQSGPALVVLASVFALAGCPQSGVDPRLGDTEGRDAGSADAAGADSGPSIDAASGIPDALPDLGGRESDCFDFNDNDDDRARDCADPGCMVEPVCCALGSVETGCCTTAGSIDLDLSSCVDGGAASCIPGATPFGRAAMMAHALPSGCAAGATVIAPGGDDSVDGGLLLDGVFDPAVSRLDLSFVLGHQPASGVARVGVALVPDEAPSARVLPVLGVEISGGSLRVVVGESVVTVSATVLPCEAASLVLSVSPAGAYTLQRDSVTIHTGNVSLPPRARLAVYGRQTSAGAEAWISELSVVRSVCSRLAPERGVTPVVRGAPGAMAIGRVSVARTMPDLLGRAVIEVDGRIFAATEVADGIQVDDMANPLVPAGSAATGPDWAGGASDPQLVAAAPGYRLLFTGADADGSTAIFVMELDDGFARPSIPLPILTPEAAVGARPSSIDSPAYFTFGGAEYLLYRAHVDEAGEARTELRLLQLLGGLAASIDTGETPSYASRDAAYAESGTPGVVRTSAGVGFERDEVGSARAVDLGDGVLRIFYAGRRGTRWSIGALVTNDLTHYDEVAAGAPLLGPSGVGFDALGALDPEPVVHMASGERRLTLYYTGTSGTASTIGSAEQALRGGP